MSYKYKHGDRPLEGYTLMRGLGRGGFGEVYYGVSDGGREVAIKTIQQNHEVELRGVRHCMNLKSPHLVCIFDLKTNADGTPFVVMEYVSGPSFRDILNHSKNEGLGRNKATYLILRIAKGLSYLHEKGIVHRDLKPENIFFEDGYAKIGDYGLSKFINVSRQSGQTISVGTVHYMAPEIGSGNYSRGIDIYSLGVIYYELLTGTVPFDGDSMGEILIKHLTSPPDLENIDGDLRAILDRCLEKKPEDRYQNIEDFVNDIENIPDLSSQAGKVSFESISTSWEKPDLASLQALEQAPTQAPQAPPQPLENLETANPTPSGIHIAIGTPQSPISMEGVSVEGRDPEPVNQAQPQQNRSNKPPQAQPKRLQNTSQVPKLELELKGKQGRGRIVNGIFAVCGIALPLALLSGSGSLFNDFASCALLIASMSTAILIVEAWAAPKFQIDMGIARRLSVLGFAGPVTVLALYLLREFGFHSRAIGNPLTYLVGIALIDWHLRVRPDRKDSIRLDHAFYAGLFGWILGYFFGERSSLMFGGIFAGISITLNTICPLSKKFAGSKFVESSQDQQRQAQQRLMERGYSEDPQYRTQRNPLTAVALFIILPIFLLYAFVGVGVGPFGLIMVLLLGGFAFFQFHRWSKTTSLFDSLWAVFGFVFFLVGSVIGIAGSLIKTGYKENIEAELPTIISALHSDAHMLIATIFFTLTVICSGMGRRHGGWLHILRGGLGWTGLSVLMGLMIDLFSQHHFEAQNIADLIRNLFQERDSFMFVIILGVIALCIVFLFWPARRLPSEPAWAQPQEGPQQHK